MNKLAEDVTIVIILTYLHLVINPIQEGSGNSFATIHLLFSWLLQLKTSRMSFNVGAGSKSGSVIISIKLQNIFTQINNSIFFSFLPT